jgi:hypothetical protein
VDFSTSLFTHGTKNQTNTRSWGKSIPVPQSVVKARETFQRFIKAYENFVLHNHTLVRPVESLLRLALFMMPGRITEHEVSSEAGNLTLTI